MRARDRLDEKRRAKAAQRARRAGGSGLHVATQHHESQTALNVQDAFMKACGLTREEARAAQRYMDANAHKLGKGNQAGMMKLFHEARDHVRPPPPDPQHILEAMGVDATTPVDATPPDALQGLFGVSLAALSLEHRGVDLGVSESVTVYAPLNISADALAEGGEMFDLPGHGIELTADMASPELRQALITGDFSAYDFPNGEEDEDGEDGD